MSKNIAFWEPFKNKLFYCVLIKEGCKIHEVLGIIKPKNDGRWWWVRKDSSFHENEWHGGNLQGVSNSKEEAESRILEGWNE